MRCPLRPRKDRCVPSAHTRGMTTESLLIPDLSEWQGEVDWAKVIGGDPTHWYNSRILDIGLDAVITRDCAVISADGVVGRIVQVSRRSSVLQLVTDLDSGVGVFLETSRAHGVLD